MPIAVDETEFELKPNQFSAAHQVYAQLLRALVSLELKPNTRISEVEIAARYGVSRQPVREALITLAHTGLIKTLPQRGTFVVPISASQMLEARFVREVIEVAVAKRACNFLLPQARSQLDTIILQQEAAVAQSDRDRFFRYDEAFHFTLCEGIGAMIAWDSIKNVKIHMDRVCSLTLKDDVAMMPLIAEHKAILAAIDAHDSSAAGQAMQAHLESILDSLPKVEAENPELFQ